VGLTIQNGTFYSTDETCLNQSSYLSFYIQHKYKKNF
jgi:hypothetical protein